MMIKQPMINDRDTVIDLLNAISLFTDEERDVAIELLDDFLSKGDKSDYCFYVACNENMEYMGFICFGPTPMTFGTYDLYWIGTHDGHARKGIAKKLVDFMKDYMRETGGRLIRIETSGKELYGGTQAFYDGIGMVAEAVIKDFYSIDDDLIIYTCRV